MKQFVFFCVECNQTFVGEDYTAKDQPRCPKCNHKTLPTGYEKDQWLALTKEERDAVCSNLREQGEKDKLENEDHGASHKERPNTVVAFVDEHVGVVGGLRTLLYVLATLAAVFWFFCLAFVDVGWISIASYVLGVLIGILIDLYISCWFAKVAIMKGHKETAVFWMPFLLGLVGYLFIIALPDRNPGKWESKDA